MTTRIPSPRPAARPPRSRRPSSCSTVAPSAKPSSTESRQRRSRRELLVAVSDPEEAGNTRLSLLLAAAMFVLVVDTSLMNVSISAVVKGGPGLRCVHPDQQQARRPLRTQEGVRVGSAGVCDWRTGDDPRGEPGGDHHLLGDHRRPGRLAPPARHAIAHPWHFEGAAQKKTYALIGAAAAIAAAVGPLLGGF